METAEAPRVFGICDLPPDIFDKILLKLDFTERAFLAAAILPDRAQPIKWKREAAVNAAGEKNFNAVLYICENILARCPLRKHKRDPRWESMLLRISKAGYWRRCQICTEIAYDFAFEYRKVYKNYLPGYEEIVESFSILYPYDPNV